MSPRFVGVPTTTPVAFQSAGLLYLERMNILSEEGCGILCDSVPIIGEIIPLVFRLSTQKRTLRCRARVEAAIPTTPAGVKLAAELGEKGLHAATASTMGDSATMMFRMEDLQRAAVEAQKPVQKSTRPVGKATGFAVSFVDLDKDARDLVAAHIRISRRLSDQVARQGGASSSLAEDDRSTLKSMFDEDGLSDRARDW
ncbi:MAG: hypothetical protein HY904_04835 [Deltaproteobacteria bacterium]|nr:hypothetical protein [Deltaproteobacteria bacterium]